MWRRTYAHLAEEAGRIEQQAFGFLAAKLEKHCTR